MDKILEQLLSNEVEAEGRLDFANTEFEKRICIDVINKAKALTNAYISFKKHEENYNKAIDGRTSYYNRVTIGYDTICACCGKEFLRQPEWIYKSGSNTKKNWYCSYNCMRKRINSRQK